MRHEFVALLGSSIERDWIVNLVIGGIWYLFVGTIHRGRGSIDKMLDLMMTACLKDVVEAYQVTLNVSIGVGDRIAHTSLGCKIYNNCGLVSGENLLYCHRIGNGVLDEDPIALKRGYLTETFLLDVDIIIVGHGVDTYDLDVLDIMKKTLDKVTTNKTGCSGNEDGFALKGNIIG